MAKVMLVEDDNNLREIYQARLIAEGYDIIAAKDGEEALALAVKEKPELVLLDVMMPKVSGFELLDILRGTESIRNTKVIMMTALSQAEDKARAEKLGANRYLVKSQVTLEDMAKAVQDVLNEGDNPSPPLSTAPPSQPAAPITDIPLQSPPVNPEPPAVDNADSTSTSAESILSNAADSLANAGPATSNPITKDVTSTPNPILGNANPAPATQPASTPKKVKDDDGVTIAKKKIIQPINDLSKPKTDLKALLEKEEAKNIMMGSVSTANDTPNLNGDDLDIPSGSSLNNPLQQLPNDTPHPNDPNSIAL